MEAYEATLSQAQRHVHLADYTISQAFKTIQDPKVICSGISKLHTAHMLLIRAILKHEHEYKRVRALPTTSNTTKTITFFEQEFLDKTQTDKNMKETIREVATWNERAQHATTLTHKGGSIFFGIPGAPIHRLPIKNLTTYILHTKKLITIADGRRT